MESQIFGTLVKTAMAGVLATGFGLVAMPPSPAVAVGCTGNGCQGKSPQSNGCSSGATFVSGTGHYLVPGDSYVEMRKSSSCKARWARLTIDNANHVAETIMVQRQIKSPYGWFLDGESTHKHTVLNMGDGNSWTSMVPDVSDDRFRVCIGYDSSADDWCSDWKN